MNYHLNFLANLIIQHYFLDSRCLIIFSDDSNAFDCCGSIPVVRINVQNTSHYEDLIFHYFGCQGIILANNEPTWTLQLFEDLIKLNMERFNSRKYLILPGVDQQENLSDVFEVNELTYISDLVVVEQSNRNNTTKYRGKQLLAGKENFTYNLWTHQYVGMESNKRILLDVWSSDTKKFEFKADLFPNKLLNQMGRELRMATFRYEPYSIIGKKTNIFL